MPKVKEGKIYSKGYSESELDKALEAIKNGMGKLTAAKKFNIPRATLQFRLSKEFVKSRPGPDTVLSSQEENQLVQWIIESCRKGFPRRKEDIIQSVKLFLIANPRSNSFIENTPGEGWYKLFLKRHPEIALRTSEAVTSASSKISESNIRSWFTQIENYLKENNLFHILSDPSRVYNGDETNFILCPKNTKVIAPKGEKNVYEVDHAPSKSCITVMFTFGADGDTTPPMIIFPLKRMRPEIRKSVPKEWGIGLSDNGWMKAEVFIQYIKNVLHPALQKKNVTFPVILFVDGHKSHTTLELSQLCQSLGIILIALYPNATRLLQPADVAAFRPIKLMWRKAVLEWRANNLTKTLLKTDVGSILDNVLPKLKKSTLINGFKACGLCPFNPDEVDYTKCLMPAKPQRAILDDNSSVNMNYQIFQEIVGPQLIRKMKAQVVAKSVEAKKLFEIYKYLAPKHSAQNSFSLAEPSTNSDEIPIDCSMDVSDIVIHEDYEVFNQNIAFAPEMEICTSEPTITPEAIFEYQKENVPNDASVNNLDNILIKTTESEIPVSDLPYALSTTNDSSMDRTTKTPEVIFENQKENKPDEDASITPAYCIPSTSRQNVEFVGGEWVLVDITPNENLETQQIQTKLKDFLPIPKTPIKKHKQHVSKQHQTFVLTSKEWEDMELKKQQKKIEENQEKEDKRKARLEKAELTRLAKAKKAIDKQNKKYRLKTDKQNKNLIKTDSQTKTDQAKKSSNIKIISNVVIKTANTTYSEKNEGLISVEKNKEKECNKEIMEQEKLLPSTTKYQDKTKDLTKNEEFTEEIEDRQPIELIKTESESKATKETKRLMKNKHINKTNKPITDEDLLKILLED